MAISFLDKTDLKILQVLQDNGRLTNVELSERVALSPSPCLRRLKQLEESGIIRRYAALQSWPQVLNCFALTGESDYILQAFFSDMNAFSHFVLETLLATPGVEDAKSSFVLKEIKTTTSLPLEHLNVG